MSPVVLPGSRVHVTMWADPATVEDQAMTRLRNQDLYGRRSTRSATARQSSSIPKRTPCREGAAIRR